MIVEFTGSALDTQNSECKSLGSFIHVLLSPCYPYARLHTLGLDPMLAYVKEIAFWYLNRWKNHGLHASKMATFQAQDPSSSAYR